ncbi:MAG TPA: hypothetical protein VGB56_02315 [Flavisolibacter sp.]|jgi:hypothetical protein
MDDDFDLPVLYNGAEVLLKTRLLQSGYVHRFEVEVNEQHILFEPDEERNYRALVAPHLADKLKRSDVDLIKAVAEALEKL